MNDRPLINDLPPEYSYDENGFIKQIVRDPFIYTQDYKDHQSTNLEMSSLRLGWLAQHFTIDQMRSMEAVDVGCGNGLFVRSCEKVFRSICGYDVVGESISDSYLYGKVWDLSVLSDVLEHFDDIEKFFKIKWRYCMLSFPETPPVRTFAELQAWRHFKPNEHIYYLHAEGVKEWIRKKPSVTVIDHSNFEDLIRTRWDVNNVNISTLLLMRQIEDEGSFCNNSVP